MTTNTAEVFEAAGLSEIGSTQALQEPLTNDEGMTSGYGDPLTMDIDDFHNLDDLGDNEAPEQGYDKFDENGEDIIGNEGEEFEGFDQLSLEQSEIGKEEGLTVNVENFASGFDSIDDGQLFNIGGVEMSKADIVNNVAGAKVNQEFNDKYAAIDQHLDGHFRNLNLQAASFASEIDSQIQAYTNAKNSATTNELRGQYDQELQELTMLKRDSDVKKQAMSIEMDEAKKTMLRSKGERLNREMTQVMGSDWVAQRQSIIEYAHNEGVSTTTLNEHTDKGLISLARKAMAYDKYINKRDDSLKGTTKRRVSKSPVSTSSSSLSSPGVKKSSAKKAQDAIANGTLDKQDAFNFLED
jgi:hypothetical protein